MRKIKIKYRNKGKIENKLDWRKSGREKEIKIKTREKVEEKMYSVEMTQEARESSSPLSSAPPRYPLITNIDPTTYSTLFRRRSAVRSL
jgi:hypothetical protein